MREQRKYRNVIMEERCPTKEYHLTKSAKTICIFDCETDPFQYGMDIKPFTCGFYDGETYWDFWGDDCIAQFMQFLRTFPDNTLLIYAHNLGGFDIHFLYDYFDDFHIPMIIGSRICEARISGQVWRDSYKIVPIPLAEYQKDEFNYSKMLREKRERHKKEILKYQRNDCIYLYDLVKGFHNMFGNRITIGSASINMLRSFHGFQHLKETQDHNIRDYFYGGRCQCFETGILEDDFKVYDVNSMYPYAMATFKHPVTNVIHWNKRISEYTAFAKITAENKGCLPIRGKNGDLDFTCEEGEFFASIHEINAGLETNTLNIKKIHCTLDFAEFTTFDKFINHFYSLRLEAKEKGDKLRSIYYKLLMNNAYGKFAQNPDNYSDYLLTVNSIPLEGLKSESNPNGWEPSYMGRTHYIWKRETRRVKTYFNVATGSSITGAARAILHRALVRADRPVYCDTDSIICRGLDLDLDNDHLGAWKLEGEGTKVAIAGKKMYAVWDQAGKVVKQASKGSNLSAKQVLEVASGATILYKADVPTFKLDGTFEYLERNIKATG